MIFFAKPLPARDVNQQRLVDSYLMDEAEAVRQLVDYLEFDDSLERKIQAQATQMVQRVRERAAERSMIEQLMMHYDLSTEEGIMLMCLAEALLRIPDKATENLLIKDKLTSADWRTHVEQGDSAFVNFASWGLALTGKVLKPGDGMWGTWKRLVARSGEPVIRKAVREAIKVMSHQFVLGRSIEEALERSKPLHAKGYCFSYDMLGEVARTQADADRYYKSYQQAIHAIGLSVEEPNLFFGPSISVKLSALYPRYEFAQQQQAVPFLSERLKQLALQARDAGISLTVDAEEADRLEISLEIIAAVFNDPEFAQWEGLGLAVQSYQKRAFYLIDWLAELSRGAKKRIQVRLVKGAYWDSEIKVAQMNGYSGYPVFTRKSSTDVSYLACAKKLLQLQECIYPQFATHNAYTVAAILCLVDNPKATHFEFQNLQGMGKELHDQIVAKDQLALPCRVYAPVGSHEDLLPYLVRRLLENGANSSFVNQIADSDTPIARLVESPIAKTLSAKTIANPKIPLPSAIFPNGRRNSHGVCFSHLNELTALSDGMTTAFARNWQATPMHRAIAKEDEVIVVTNPADRRQQVGVAVYASHDECHQALATALSAFPKWDAVPVAERAQILRRTANLFEQHSAELMAIAVREAGKNLPDANAEIREAVDFLRYYADEAERELAPKSLPGYTGETNTFRLSGKGVIVCISPWNFPLAIFTGQVAAALVTGNTVIAKPAEQTMLMAARAIELFYQAGIAKSVLHYLPGTGETVGATLTSDARVSGVMFTGSTETARLINRSLAKNDGPIATLVAETGGINALIADSSALPEQLVADVIMSAFGSSGQRCSALRLLLVQEEIADKVIAMLQGAMAEIKMGNPQLLSTDFGPVIDKESQQRLLAHCEKMQREARLIYQVPLPEECQHGTFVAPQAFELTDIRQLTEEMFGPILHVARYKRSQLDQVIDHLNGLGFGLTFGIQSRINETVDYIQRRIIAGNVYVNRNIIGAVVGVQPFGGSGLSGTGPKAGGPHYLPRLCRESNLTINTTAAGGNASLMALGDEE